MDLGLRALHDLMIGIGTGFVDYYCFTGALYLLSRSVAIQGTSVSALGLPHSVLGPPHSVLVDLRGRKEWSGVVD